MAGFEIRHVESKTVQIVSSLDGYGEEEWELLRELSAEEEAALTLVAERKRKWAEVKAMRNALEDGAVPTPLGPVQSDDRSKLKISGLVQMAGLAWAAEREAAAAAGRAPDPACFQEEFTLADNRVVSLDAKTAVLLGVAVGRRVSAIHAAARGLRARIEDEAASLDGIAGIDVEAEFVSAVADEGAQ